jgi:hypothetical protein
MGNINFSLVSEFQTIHRRPFGLTDPTILNPTSVRPLVDGEFLVLDANYNMDRGGANNAGAGKANEGTVPAFAYFAERGRYEVQAIQKGPFLYMAPYEADTLIYYGTGLTLGCALSVYDVSIGGIVRRALGILTAGFVVGYVTRLPANNSNWLRFAHFA